MQVGTSSSPDSSCNQYETLLLRSGVRFLRMDRTQSGKYSDICIVLKTRPMKCYKGTILSVDSNDGVYQYLVEDNGTILFVGNELPSQYKDAELMELGDKAIVPAFVDTHQHFASFSTFNAGLNVMEAASNAEIAEMIGEYAAETKSRTIIAFGASPHSVKEGRLIMRHEIDAVLRQAKLQTW